MKFNFNLKNRHNKVKIKLFVSNIIYVLNKKLKYFYFLYFNLLIYYT